MLFVYPDASVKEEAGNLILLPGKSHIRKQAKHSFQIKKDLNQTKQINKPKENTQENIELQKKYSEYRLNATIDIVENLSDETERYNLLKKFDEYLIRKNLRNIRSKIINGQYTKAVKEEFYCFVNSHWHHVLDSLKTYKEFCELTIK